ncbi:MAG TPA: HAMP domain-containing sensor histidine kinase [Candidatus Dormibacteraeota bacterium]|nr:HAMP domain-containing sensor histidine kinase [Candidatus Dormibacteraeota bacterium]
MKITSRAKATAFFITLGACIVALTIALNVSWIVLNWREVVPLVLGVILFGFITAGVVVNTIFLVREIRRNEQHDSFLNAVTHELKTPIASLRLYLETLESRQLDEAKRREFYKNMLVDTDRLLGTVEQVLKASEVRQRNTKKNWTEVDFGKLVCEEVESARTSHHLKPEELHLEAAVEEEMLVLGNAEELRTLVHNLFDNALKYSDEQKDIAVDIKNPTLDTISLSVRDKGTGIPKSELKRIFKRFYRAQSAKTKQVKGTGLGLFIVRSVARRYGGDAYAESAGEGQGSTFFVRLPRVYRA